MSSRSEAWRRTGSDGQEQVGIGSASNTGVGGCESGLWRPAYRVNQKVWSGDHRLCPLFMQRGVGLRNDPA
jgi:hypothetical protein